MFYLFGRSILAYNLNCSDLQERLKHVRGTPMFDDFSITDLFRY